MIIFGRWGIHPKVSIEVKIAQVKSLPF